MSDPVCLRLQCGKVLSGVVKCRLWTAVSSGDPTMWEAEAGGQFVLNQPGVHGEILLNVCVIKDLG